MSLRFRSRDWVVLLGTFAVLPMMAVVAMFGEVRRWRRQSE